MRRSLPLLLIAASLPACATTGAVPSAVSVRAASAIDDLVRLNRAAQAVTAIFLPWLSPERAERVRAAAARVDTAISRVALARDLTSQDTAIESARLAIAEYKWLAGS